MAGMVARLPKEDQAQFKPLGEANVVMPLRMIEKYLHPTIALMEHLRKHKASELPGGLEVAAIYSFFL